MVNKTISPNLAPWNWRTEPAPQHIDLGLTVAVSKNISEAAPSVESKPQASLPTIVNRDLLPHEDQVCLEDGKAVNEIK